MYPTPLAHVFDSRQLSTAAALQAMVPELVSLSLNAKQVHWNVTGPSFLPIHAFTDQIADDASKWADVIAERVMALGFTVDARPSTVAAASGHLPTGRIRDRDALVALIDLVDLVAATTRTTVSAVEVNDPVGHDLAIEVLNGLEHIRWMLRAQVADDADVLDEALEWAPALAET